MRYRVVISGQKIKEQERVTALIAFAKGRTIGKHAQYMEFEIGAQTPCEAVLNLFAEHGIHIAKVDK